MMVKLNFLHYSSFQCHNIFVETDTLLLGLLNIENNSIYFKYKSFVILSMFLLAVLINLMHPC